MCNTWLAMPTRAPRAFMIADVAKCLIGDRPIDFHLDALRSFGAVVEKRPEGLLISAPERLRGTHIRLPYPSVGATEQGLLTAALAAALAYIIEWPLTISPNVVALAFLVSAGVGIFFGYYPALKASRTAASHSLSPLHMPEHALPPVSRALPGKRLS